MMAAATLYLLNFMQLYFQSIPTPEINEIIQKRDLQECSSQNNQVHSRAN